MRPLLRFACAVALVAVAVPFALARLRPDDEVAVLAYGIDAEVVRGFSKDHKATADAIVCGLILERSFLESANMGDALKLLAARTGISTYAEETGGTVVKTGAPALGASLAGVLDDLRVRYTFGYVYVPPKKLGEYRKIKVELAPAAERRLGKVAVLARKGYHATTK